MSAGAFPSEPAALARLFVVCGLGCSEEELGSLFGEFGVVDEVRCVPDKGVAYVTFCVDDPFAAARAIDFVGANDDGEMEGGVASCRKFLGGCERTLKVMLADEHGAGASVSFSGKDSLSCGDATHGEPEQSNSGRGPVVAGVSPNHSAVSSHDAHAKIAETKQKHAALHEKDPDDDPPLSRLFVVCPKGVSQEILLGAFVQLLTKLRQEHDEERDSRSCAVTDKTRNFGKNEIANEKTNDPPPGPADLESVRVVPHKGVAFAKFARASVAAQCMEAVSATGTLGGMRVKCMLAEPKAGAVSVGATRNAELSIFGGARPRLDREGSRSPGGSPKRRRAVAENPEHNHGGAVFTPSATTGTAPQRLGVRPRPPSPASSVESGGARPAATRARATRASRAFEKSSFCNHSSSDKPSGAHTTPAPPPPPHPPPPGHPTRHSPFPIQSLSPNVATQQLFPGHSPHSHQTVPMPSPPLPPGPVPWGTVYSFPASPSASGDQVSAGGVSTTSKGRGSSSSKKRVFVVLDKCVTKAQLERAFRETCDGVEAVDLKRDPGTGNSRGFAYVTFTETSFALAAAERLDGAEIPPGMGKRVKVMPAEEPVRRGRGGGRSDGVTSGVSVPFEPTNCLGDGHETDTETGTEKVREALRRPREDGDEDASSWRPLSGKHARIATVPVDKFLRRDENETTTSDGRETTAEDDAGEAARALGKVTLGTIGVGETKTTETGDEKGTPRAREDFEELGATVSDAADTATQSPGRLFFSLALPLPSYAVRHVLDTKGVVAKLHMRRDGASGWAEYGKYFPITTFRRVIAHTRLTLSFLRSALADDADAAAVGLDRSEILGIQFRLSRKPFCDESVREARGQSGALEGREDVETSANAAENGVAAKKRARTTLTS